MQTLLDSKSQESLRNLTLIFIVWKSLIASIALLSPGIGYDTSADLLATLQPATADTQDVPDSISHVLLKFVRWDAIYYTEMARMGHVHEQRWAFGKGLSTVLIVLAKVLGLHGNTSSSDYAGIGIMVSHVAHWLSAILLFFIAGMVQGPKTAVSSSTAMIAAVLHVISPGGIFLSAPYSESLFSLLSMLGYFLYLKSVQRLMSGVEASGLVLKLSSGVALGCAAAVRGNGILGGIPFFIDAVDESLHILNPRVDDFAKSSLLLRLQFTILSGCCVAAGLIYPQFLAYKDYCMIEGDLRPWCRARIPSIFAFVQSHYWNVGFLRYWTISNLPLFLLATPCLYLLIVSGYQHCRPALRSSATPLQRLQLRIALPQLILAVLALTNYHVQIITRLSSGYPMWYIWLATQVRSRNYSEAGIRILVMYGLIQAGLFASFLPPA